MSGKRYAEIRIDVDEVEDLIEDLIQLSSIMKTSFSYQTRLGNAISLLKLLVGSTKGA